MSMHSTACSIIIKVITGVLHMSTLHHESLLETCFETAVEEFMTSNQLTQAMFSEIENHAGVQLALEKSANRIFEDLCQ